MILQGAAWGAQLLLSIVVLGLSITLARMGHYGSPAPQIGYAVFASALATFAALAGVVSLFVESIRWFTVFVLDGVATLALLVSGIIFAVTLKGVKCSDFTKNSAQNSFYNIDHGSWHNAILSGGKHHYDSLKGTYWWWDSAVSSGYRSASDMQGNCRSAQADTVFMFLAFAACAGALVATFLSRR